MVLGVNLPKSVYLDNARLFFLYVLLIVLTLTGVVIKFVHYKEWGQLANMDVGISMWVPYPDVTDLEQEYSKYANSDWCKSLVTDKHAYGQEPTFQGCVPLCNLAGTKCVHPHQLYTQESESKILMHTREESLFRTFNGNVTHEESYLPEATGLSIGFAYAVTQSDSTRSSSTKNIRTQLRKNGKVVDTLQPQAFIHLNVPRLLDLASSSTALDVPHDSLASSGLNQIPARFTGMELQLKVSCNEIKESDPTCAVDVEFSPTPWVFREETVTMPDGSSHVRTVHGIRIAAIGKGTERRTSLTTIVNSFTSALVLLTLPRWIIYLIAAYCLGHLSNIYAGVVHENFDLTEQVAGMATRLMTSSALFLDLQDEDGCIARECMHERLKQVFRELGGKLSDEEVTDFCNFCFHGVVAARSPEDPMHHIVSDIMDQVHKHKTSGKSKMQRMKTETEGKKISATQFNVAYSSIEQVSFSHVVELFDVERSRGILERFFSPDSVKKYVIAKAHRKQQLNLIKFGTMVMEVPGGFPAEELPDNASESVVQSASNPDSLAARKRMIILNTQRTIELSERTSEVEVKMEDQHHALERLREAIEGVQHTLTAKWRELDELNTCTVLQLQNKMPVEHQCTRESRDASGLAAPGKICIV